MPLLANRDPRADQQSTLTHLDASSWTSIVASHPLSLSLSFSHTNAADLRQDLHAVSDDRELSFETQSPDE